MQKFLKRYPRDVSGGQQQRGPPTQVVTHDQREELTLADRIAILKDGSLSAIGRTADLYRRPPNRFAAEFLGRANLLPVVGEGSTRRDGMVAVRAGDDRLVVASDEAPTGARRLI